MWQKKVLAFALFGASFCSFAQQPSQPQHETALRAQWQATQQERLEQRAAFLRFEALLNSANKQNGLSEPTLALLQKLQTQLEAYPLKPYAELALLKAQGKSANVEQIIAFTERYPELAKRHQLHQLPFSLLFEQQKLEPLVAYAEKVPPNNPTDQCRVFAARFQLLSEKSELNPEATQAAGLVKGHVEPSPAMHALLETFEQFWFAPLPNACQGIEAYWRDQGGQTEDKIRQQAVNLFQKNAKSELAALAQAAQNTPLAEWLNELVVLSNTPSRLAEFVEQQEINPYNQVVVRAAFSRWVKTLPEQGSADFSRYQAWWEKWQLYSDTEREWKIAFLQQLFDNQSPDFQKWRDSQLEQLKEDSLTERRIRMAIWQKTALTPWLNLLSDEAKNKQEWRYWRGKVEPAQRQTLWESLAKERGFYPMLAASQLQRPYTFSFPQADRLNETERRQFAAHFERIEELRFLGWAESAKSEWLELLQAVDFRQKLAMASEAIARQWFDLAVEATIQAKAWDYLPQRLPNAYENWFALHLEGKPISKTFAMAIARQESAWNPSARSHANAVGLMQLLPSTAAQTAKNSQLPYRTEAELLEPFRNIMLGTAHLNELNQLYPNNRILIAAAYNAGVSRVSRWLERADGRLEMDEFIASIPFFETRGYVQNVLTYDYFYQVLQGVQAPKAFNAEEWRRY